MKTVERLLQKRTAETRHKTAASYNEKNQVDTSTCGYVKGEKVLVHFPQDALITGRKLRSAWRGPMLQATSC